MKACILGLFFLGSSSIAFSCPNLTGTYQNIETKEKIQFIQDKGDCSQIQFIAPDGGKDIVILDGKPQGTKIITISSFDEHGWLTVTAKMASGEPLGESDGLKIYQFLRVEYLSDNGETLNTRTIFYGKDGEDLAASASTLKRVH